MRIGLILEQFDPARGGLEHWTWQYARMLKQRGHEVHVVAFEFYAGTKEDGVVPHRLEMPKSRLARAEAIAGYLPSMTVDVTHDMGIGWSADVIHPHGGSTKALWEHNLLRIPKWRQIRFWREKRYRELEELEKRQHGNESAVIVAVSRMVARHFEQYHHLPPSRVRVIYNGVDAQRFSPAPPARRGEARQSLGLGDETLFLMLAHNLLLKNADATMRAMARLVRSQRCRLVIAGGKRPDRFVRLAQKLNLSEFVTFLGNVDPIPYYAAADVFVHPTWYDPCSLVTLEAAACGLPVITTRYNGMSELMTDGREGFVLDEPGDINALAIRMKSLIAPELRNRMGAAGRLLAEGNPFEKQTDEFLRLYQEILERRAR